MEHFEPYLSYALALFAGLLIGLEREQSRPPKADNVHFIGGVRTFPIFALIGAISTSLASALGPWPFGLAMAATLLFTVLSWRMDAEKGESGLTSEGAFLLTFLLGALSGTHGVCSTPEKVFIVAALSVITTMLLSAKPLLHDFTAKISRDDVIATVKFLLLAVVTLPLLPDEKHGPYGVLNPYDIGVMVALIAGVSFVGYAASRVLGPGRGLLLTGIVGGLASSTAVTLSAAQRSKEHPELSEALALSVVVASVVKGVRVIVLVAATYQAMVPNVVVPLAAMSAVGAVYCVYLYLRTRKQSSKGKDPKLENPFELSSALKFGAAVVGVMLVSRWAQDHFGNVALYLTSLLSGLADVDAITLSVSNMAAQQQTTAAVATGAIFAAVAANTVTKMVMALVIGARPLAVRVSVGLGAMIAAGGAGLAAHLLVSRG